MYVIRVVLLFAILWISEEAICRNCFDLPPSSIHPDSAHAHYNYGRNAWLEKDYASAIDHWDQGGKIWKCLGEENLEYSKCIHNIGYLFKEQQSYELAFKFLDSARVIRKNLASPKYYYLGTSYFNLAEILANDHADYFNAIDYYYNAISCFEEALKYGADPSKVEDNVAKALNNIGTIYNDILQPENALIALNKSLNIPDRTISNKAKIYHNSGNAYDDLGEYENAIKAYKTALQYYIEAEEMNEAIGVLNNIGVTYRKVKAFDNAIRYLNQGLETCDTLIGADINKRRADLFHNLGDVHFDKKEWRLALRNYQKSVQFFEPDLFNRYQPDYDFSGIQVKDESKMDLLIFLGGEANTLFQIYSEDRNKSDLQAATKLFEFCNRIAGDMKDGLNDRESKLFLVNKFRPLVESTIEAAYHNNDFELAFEFAEKNKSLVLLSKTQEISKIRNNESNKLLFEELIKMEKENFDIEQILSKMQREDDPSLFDNLIYQKVELSEEMDKMRAKLEKESYAISRLESEKAQASLEIIQQQLLDRNTLLIEYFVGARNLFIFKVSSRSIDLFQIPKENLNLYGIVSRLNSSIMKDEHSDFVKSAASLYDILLDSVLKDSKRYENLIIIPDSFLYALPFETLLKSPPKIEGYGDYSVHNLDYLIKDHAVTYGYSANVLVSSRQLSNKEKRLIPFISFAPDFGNNSGNPLSKDPLPYSIDEADQTAGLFRKGKSMTGLNVTKSVFLELGIIARGILLATHAIADDQQEFGSRVFFSNGDSITLAEIQFVQFNADYIILSACQSGSGRLTAGEGVNSIARGFRLGGIPSTTMTLWEQNDEAASRIVIEYIKRLKKGKSKDEALRQAKLDYLNETSNPIPRYWSAFIHMGDSRPVYNNFFTRSQYFLICLLLVLLLAVGIRRTAN
ncbi:MAG: CHAT domain-containing tetratricopeptide repeat protein [Bacteroidota bacterium]